MEKTLKRFDRSFVNRSKRLSKRHKERTFQKAKKIIPERNFFPSRKEVEIYAKLETKKERKSFPKAKFVCIKRVYGEGILYSVS